MAGAHRAATPMDADMAEVQLLAQEFRRIRSRLKPAMRKATVKSARKVQNQARANWRAVSSGATTAAYPKTITYEILEANASTVRAEIGAVKGGIGSLAHIFEFGTSRKQGHPHLIPAWEAETEQYVENLAANVESAVLG